MTTEQAAQTIQDICERTWKELSNAEELLLEGGFRDAARRIHDARTLIFGVANQPRG